MLNGGQGSPFCPTVCPAQNCRADQEPDVRKTTGVHSGWQAQAAALQLRAAAQAQQQAALQQAALQQAAALQHACGQAAQQGFQPYGLPQPAARAEAGAQLAGAPWRPPVPRAHRGAAPGYAPQQQASPGGYPGGLPPAHPSAAAAAASMLGAAQGSMPLAHLIALQHRLLLQGAVPGALPRPPASAAALAPAAMQTQAAAAHAAMAQARSLDQCGGVSVDVPGQQCAAMGALKRPAPSNHNDVDPENLCAPRLCCRPGWRRSSTRRWARCRRSCWAQRRRAGARRRHPPLPQPAALALCPAQSGRARSTRSRQDKPLQSELLHATGCLSLLAAL